MKYLKSYKIFEAFKPNMTTDVLTQDQIDEIMDNSYDLTDNGFSIDLTDTYDIYQRRNKKILADLATLNVPYNIARHKVMKMKRDTKFRLSIITVNNGFKLNDIRNEVDKLVDVINDFGFKIEEFYTNNEAVYTKNLDKFYDVYMHNFYIQFTKIKE